MKKPARDIRIDEVLPKGAPPRLSEDPVVAFLARLMDTQFVVPGTKIRFGLDPILGLLPAFGDSAGALVSTLLILQSSRHGVPRVVLARMALNVLINTLGGAIPGLGDLFSLWFKSNVRNYDLLRKHAGTRRQSTAGDWAFVVALLAGLLLVVGLIIAGLISVLMSLLGGNSPRS
nr:DUF4112 domain-containing protein [Verrucomicrobiota bacterium]